MGKPMTVVFLLVSSLVMAVPLSTAVAQQTIEGTVTSTTLTACDFKPGTCEGNVVLEIQAVGPRQVTIKVPKGTQIKQGNEHLFLPGVKGRLVAITYVEDKGEKVAKSIEVKRSKP